MRTAAWLAVLLLLSVGAFAEDVAGPSSENALHFKVEIGGEKPKTVLGWFDESKGTGKGLDVVVLDLDGDGKAETRQALQKMQFDIGEGLKEMVQMQCAVAHEGAHWTLTYQDINAWRSADEEPLPPQYMFSCTVTKGGAMVAFGGGSTVKLHASAAAAAKAGPLRVGGKIAFDVSATTRGSDPLLNISVVDAGGNRLSQMRIRGKSVPPEFVLSVAGEQKLTGSAEYG